MRYWFNRKLVALALALFDLALWLSHWSICNADSFRQWALRRPISPGETLLVQFHNRKRAEGQIEKLLTDAWTKGHGDEEEKAGHG